MTIQIQFESRSLQSIDLYDESPTIMEPDQAEEIKAARLQFYGFEERNVVQDNHRLFRSLSDQIYGNQAHHNAVRRTAVAQLTGDRAAWYRNRTTRPHLYDTYCGNLLRDHAGDNSVIQAISDAYWIKIVVLSDELLCCIREVVPYLFRFKGRGRRSFKKVVYISRTQHSTNSMFKIGEVPDESPPNLHQFFPEDLPDLLKMSWSLFGKLRSISEPTNQFDRLGKRLTLFGYEQVVSIGDGHCVFRSVSRHFYQSQEFYSLVRKTAVAQLQEYRARYQPYVPTDYDEYCKGMLGRKWADGIVTQAIADAYRVKIVELVSNRPFSIWEYIPSSQQFKREVLVCSTSQHSDSMYQAGKVPPFVEEQINKKRRLDGFFKHNDLRNNTKPLCQD